MPQDLEGLDRRNIINLLEVTLYEGVSFRMEASSTPYADGRDKTSDKPGGRVVGYVHEETDNYITMSPSRSPGEPSNLGGFTIHKRAIKDTRRLPPHYEGSEW